jgi:hypothetical protein
LSLDGPLREHAWVPWGVQALSVALDTSMSWHTYSLSRLSVLY